MGIIADLLKEVPLSAVLKERLSEYEKSDAQKDAKIHDLEAKVKYLETALSAAQPQIATAITQRDICPHCGHAGGKQISFVPDHPRSTGGTEKYRCAGCGNDYEKRKT